MVFAFGASVFTRAARPRGTRRSSSSARAPSSVPRRRLRGSTPSATAGVSRTSAGMPRGRSSRRIAVVSTPEASSIASALVRTMRVAMLAADCRLLKVTLAASRPRSAARSSAASMRGCCSRGPTTANRTAPRCRASVASIAPLSGSAGTVRASTPVSSALVVAGDTSVRPATAPRLSSTRVEDSGPTTAWASGMLASVRAKVRAPVPPESPGRRVTSDPSTPPAALASSTASRTAACVAGP